MPSNEEHPQNLGNYWRGIKIEKRSIMYFEKLDFKFVPCLFIVILGLAIIYFLQPINEILSQVRVFNEHTPSSPAPCTFVILCGTGDTDTVEEMRPLLASAILLTSRPLHFILVADANSSERAHQFFQNNLNASSKLVSVDIWTISTKFIEEWANSFRFNVLGVLENKRVWLIAKLFVPWLLYDHDQVIVIDSDMVFLEDPAMLWSEFDDDRSWAYKLPLNEVYSFNSICSCIVLINIPTVLKNDFYPEKFLHAMALAGTKPDPETGLYDTERVDQHVYYYLFKAYPHLFRTLKQQFNIDYCHKFYGAFDNVSSSVKVSLLHMNCGNWDEPLRESSEVFFNFYEQFRWAWFRGEPGKTYNLSISTFVHNASLFPIVPLNATSSF